MKARLNSQRGFSLIEVLVATAIMSILAVGMMQLFESQFKSVRAIKVSLENAQTGALIARNAGMATSLARSGGTAIITAPPGNDPYRRCVLGLGPTAGCTAATVTGFSLTDSAGTILTGPTGGTPLYYDLQGLVCATPGPTCPFQAHTSFTATCPAASPSPCPQADTITVTYVYEQIPGVFINNASVMNGRRGSVTVSIPLAGFINGAADRLALWSTSTDLVAANIVQGTGLANGQIQINQDGTYAGAEEALRVNGRILMPTGSGGVAAPCTAAQQGSLRNLNGTLQVCDGANWLFASGALDSAASSMGFGPAGHLLRTPRLPGLYACPLGGQASACNAAGQGPVCAGQVSPYINCCMTTGVSAVCSPLF